MNKKLKKTLKSNFDAPKPIRKIEFLSSLPYPKATNLEFCLSQIGYIRKRFWGLSALLLIGVSFFSLRVQQNKEFVSLLSAVLPLLTLIGITEISKSLSYNMTELEMSCKYNLAKITLIRISTMGTFHFVILLLALLLFKDRSQYGMFRYVLYAITPFLLSSYLSFWVTNNVKSKEASYISSGVCTFVSMGVFAMSLNFSVIYTENYTLLWSMIFIGTGVLLMKEIYFLLTEGEEQWSFV